MTFPDAAKNIKIGHSRSRGRPANNPGALKRLRKEAIEEETILSFSESEHEEEAIEVVQKKRGRKRKEKQIELADDDDEFDLFEGSASKPAAKATSKPAAKKPRTNTNSSNSSQAEPSTSSQANQSNTRKKLAKKTAESQSKSLMLPPGTKRTTRNSLIAKNKL